MSFSGRSCRCGIALMLLLLAPMSACTHLPSDTTAPVDIATIKGTTVVTPTTGEEQFVSLRTGRRYVLVPGSFTFDQAVAEAKRRGGDLFVISDAAEFAEIVSAFGLPRRFAIRVGHYQLSTGREPHEGWVTVTGERGFAPFNGPNGGSPDDGCTWDWSWGVGGGGIQIGRHRACKNEDSATLWVDNGGRLEDISANGRHPILIEFRR